VAAIEESSATESSSTPMERKRGGMTNLLPLLGEEKKKKNSSGKKGGRSIPERWKKGRNRGIPPEKEHVSKKRKESQCTSHLFL